MTTIGTLEPTRDGGWAGPIFLLGQHVKVKLTPNDDQSNPKAPAFRIFASAANLGALWLHKGKDEHSQNYLSGQINCPGVSEPILLAGFFADEQKKLEIVWRPQSKGNNTGDGQ